MDLAVKCWMKNVDVANGFFIFLFFILILKMSDVVGSISAAIVEYAIPTMLPNCPNNKVTNHLKTHKLRCQTPH